MSDDEKGEETSAVAATEPRKRSAAKPAAHRATKAEPWTAKKWGEETIYLCAGKLPNGRPCNYDTFVLAEMEDHAMKQHPGA